MPNHRRCRSNFTGITGTIVAEEDHRTPFDGDLGPWFYVGFDDGLRCWVLQDDVTELVPDVPLPIHAPAGVAPPDMHSTDEKQVIDHIGDLLIGAQEWAELLQAGSLLHPINLALEAALNLGAGT